MYYTSRMWWNCRHATQTRMLKSVTVQVRSSLPTYIKIDIFLYLYNIIEMLVPKRIFLVIFFVVSQCLMTLVLPKKMHLTLVLPKEALVSTELMYGDISRFQAECMVNLVSDKIDDNKMGWYVDQALQPVDSYNMADYSTYSKYETNLAITLALLPFQRRLRF